MSRQINFFADSADTVALHRWLLEEFPDLRVIPRDRASPEELEPIPAAEALAGSGVRFLVPRWAQGRIKLRPIPNGHFRVDMRASPVIEYSPSLASLADNAVSVGRLYWSYGGELSTEERRQLDRMFRWVRTHTVPDLIDPRFRVFEHAARNGRRLNFEFGASRVAPPWRG